MEDIFNGGKYTILYIPHYNSQILLHCVKSGITYLTELCCHCEQNKIQASSNFNKGFGSDSEILKYVQILQILKKY